MKSNSFPFPSPLSYPNKVKWILYFPPNYSIQRHSKRNDSYLVHEGALAGCMVNAHGSYCHDAFHFLWVIIVSQFGVCYFLHVACVKERFSLGKKHKSQNQTNISGFCFNTMENLHKGVVF